MIREATMEDVPAIVELGRAMLEEAPHFRELAFSPACLASSIEALIESSAALVAVAEINGEVAGCMVAMASPHWAADAIEVTELALYVRADHRRTGAASALIERFKQFASDNGAAIVRAGASAGISDDQVVRLYERAGFKVCGFCLQLR